MVVGGAGCDNWLIFHCRRDRVSVVDITGQAPIIHHGHDYSRVGAGKQHIWSGLDALRNIELAGGASHLFDIMDATHVLGAHGTRRARGAKHVEKRVERLRQYRPKLL